MQQRSATFGSHDQRLNGGLPVRQLLLAFGSFWM
jgi:hypothetical protein